MIIDQTRIANMALMNLGEPVIQSLTQQGRNPAVMKQRYDEARIEALCGAPWGFASVWADLVPLAIDPKPGFSYAFTYPTDALNIFYLNHVPGTDAPPFAVSSRRGVPGKMISCNIEEPTAIYTLDKEDVTTFDWPFVVALSWLLASKGAMPITKNPKIEASCYNRYMLLASMAETKSRNESPEEQAGDELAPYQAVRL